jgi:hypothetical protein
VLPTLRYVSSAIVSHSLCQSCQQGCTNRLPRYSVHHVVSHLRYYCRSVQCPIKTSMLILVTSVFRRSRRVVHREYEFNKMLTVAIWADRDDSLGGTMWRMSTRAATVSISQCYKFFVLAIFCLYVQRHVIWSCTQYIRTRLWVEQAPLESAWYIQEIVAA